MGPASFPALAQLWPDSTSLGPVPLRRGPGSGPLRLSSAEVRARIRPTPAPDIGRIWIPISTDFGRGVAHGGPEVRRGGRSKFESRQKGPRGSEFDKPFASSRVSIVGGEAELGGSGGWSRQAQRDSKHERRETADGVPRQPLAKMSRCGAQGSAPECVPFQGSVPDVTHTCRKRRCLVGFAQQPAKVAQLDVDTFRNLEVREAPRDRSGVPGRLCLLAIGLGGGRSESGPGMGAQGSDLDERQCFRRES